VSKPVVLIAEELSPATLDALGPDFEIRNCDGANRAELLPALAAGVDAVLIRSATKMDAEAIAAAKGLKVIDSCINSSRRHGGQCPNLEYRKCCRTCHRTFIGIGSSRISSACSPEEWKVGAL